MILRLKGKHLTILAVLVIMLSALFVGYSSSGSAQELYFAANRNMPAVRQGEQPNTMYIFPNGRMWSNDTAHLPWQETEAMFLKVIEQYPDTVWAKHSTRRLAELYLMQSDYQKAEAYATQAINNDDPMASEAYSVLVAALEEQTDTKRHLRI